MGLYTPTPIWTYVRSVRRAPPSASSDVSANAECPTASATGNDPTISIAVNAEQPSGSGAAFDASVEVSPNAEAPSGSGAANTAESTTVAAGTEQPTGVGAASDAAPTVAVNAECPAGQGDAYDAVANTGILFVANSFEGGSNGTTITTGNSGGSSGTAFDAVSIVASGTATYTSTSPFRGSISASLTTAGTSGQTYVQHSSSLSALATAGSSPLYGRAYINLPSLPATDTRVAVVTDSVNNFCAEWRVDSAGHLLLYSGTGVLQATSTATVSANTWFRVEVAVLVWSATVGQIEAKLFTTVDAVTPTETLTSSANLNTARSGGLTQNRWGICRNVASYSTMLDDVGWSVAGYMGPTAVTPAAESPSASGTGFDAGPSVAPNGEAPTGSGVAGDPAPTVAVNAEQPGATGTAYDATVTTAAVTNAPAECPSGTGTAYDAGSVSVAVNAEQSAGTGTAQNAAPTVAITTDAPVGAGVALDGTPAISINAESPTAGGTAYDATVSTVADTNAPAGNAAGAGAASDPTVTVAVNAEYPTGSGQAFDATAVAGGNTNVNAGVATGAGVADNAGALVGASPGAPSGLGVAWDPATAVAPVADWATGAGEAFDAVIGLPVYAMIGVDGGLTLATVDGGATVGTVDVVGLTATYAG